MKLGLVVLTGWLCAACLRTPAYRCETSDQCGDGGRCEGSGYCSVADSTCAGGFRWGGGAPDAGECVAPGGDTIDVCLVQTRRAPTDSTCVADVCAAMPRCCAREWSDQCVQLAETTCQHPCGTVMATIGNGLVRVMTWDGAAYAPLWSKTTFASNGQYASVAWGDVDGDHKPDLATCESPTTTLPGAMCIWTNGGSCGEAFCQKECIEVSDCQRVAWLDVDDDGDLDLIGMGAYNSYLWINDQGLFGTALAGAPLGPDNNSDAAWADLDGDGIYDVALSRYGFTDEVARVTVGGPDGLTLTTAWTDSVDDQHEQVAFGDVDVDGKLDLLATGNGMIQIWRNTSDTSFAAAATPYFDHPGYNVPGSALADGDEDGDLDIVVAASGANLAVLRNNHAQGSDDFTQTPSWQSAAMFGDGRVAIGDVDGDHHLDIVVGMTPLDASTATSVFLARPSDLGQFGTAAPAGQASWVDPDAAVVEDIALTGAW